MPLGAVGSPRLRAAIGLTLALGLLASVVVLPDAGTVLVVSHGVESPDAIISLGSHEWERLPAAAALARRFPHAWLLLTLPETVTEFNCHDCSDRVAQLERSGVDPGRIRVLPLTQPGTHGEAVATLDATHELHFRRLMIVTSPYHTRRAFATFREVLQGSGVEIGIEPVRKNSPANPAQWWRTRYDRWYVRYEWAASLYYLIRYGVNSWKL